MSGNMRVTVLYVLMVVAVFLACVAAALMIVETLLRMVLL